MDDLIEALKIFRKYGNPYNPVHCEHDVLTICDIDHEEVSTADISRLKELGFFIDDDDSEQYFISYRFGSA